jgi:hydrogenase expression/formation protein HypE
VQSGVRIEVEESAIPITESVEGACELLGLDPLHLANEGVLVALVPAEGASLVLDAMRNHPLGHKAQIIGEVCSKKLPPVILLTPIGGKRVLAVPTGVQLPRIC